MARAARLALILVVQASLTGCVKQNPPQMGCSGVVTSLELHWEPTGAKSREPLLSYHWKKHLQIYIAAINVAACDYDTIS